MAIPHDLELISRRCGSRVKGMVGGIAMFGYDKAVKDACTKFSMWRIINKIKSLDYRSYYGCITGIALTSLLTDLQISPRVILKVSGNTEQL